jgi:UDP-glucose 6-dehydrogenase
LGIIGDNYLADSIRAGLDSKTSEHKQVIYKDIESLFEWQPQVIFICLDVPFLKNGSSDDAEFVDTILRISKTTKSGICIKTSINIDTLNKLISAVGKEFMDNKVVYSPELYEDTESVLNSDFVFLGGSPNATAALRDVLYMHSFFQMKEVVMDTIHNVVFAKLGLSGYRAVKQTFFNQLHQTIVDVGGSNPTAVRRLMLKHPIMMDTSVTLPTFVKAQSDASASYKQTISYSGEYANSDVRLLSGMTDKLSVLDECINLRNLKD